MNDETAPPVAPVLQLVPGKKPEPRDESSQLVAACVCGNHLFLLKGDWRIECSRCNRALSWTWRDA